MFVCQVASTGNECATSAFVVSDIAKDRAICRIKIRGSNTCFKCNRNYIRGTAI